MKTSVSLLYDSSYHRLTLSPKTDMIIDNDPVITRSISVPRDMSQLSCSSFTAGIVEAVLDGLGFVSSVLSDMSLADLSSSLLASRLTTLPPTISLSEIRY